MTFMGVMELDQEWKGDQNSEKKVYCHVSFVHEIARYFLVVK